MKKIVISTQFKEVVLEKAKKMVLEEKNKDVFSEKGKVYEGLNIFIDNKPNSVLFSFDFPEDFEPGVGKKIYIGNN